MKKTWGFKLTTSSSFIIDIEVKSYYEGRGTDMEKIIEFRKYPLDLVLGKLLIDKTTGKPIIWATNSYSEIGNNYGDRFTITLEASQGVNPVLIQPRAFKALETQQQRTKSQAEFSPLPGLKTR